MANDKYINAVGGNLGSDRRDIVVRQISQLGRKVIPPGGSLFLYGSQARGDANNDSDWDLLILLDKSKVEQSDFDNIAFPFINLGWDINEMISAHTYTKEYWEKNHFLPFVKNVERDKIVLV